MKIRQAIATFRGNHVPGIDFVGRTRYWFVLSGVLMVLAVIGLVGPGLNFSIAFEGGAQIEFASRSGATVTDYQAIMRRYERAEAQVKILGDDQVVIRTESLTELGLEADRLREELAREAGIPASEINEEDVGPTWGASISRKALTGLIVFLVAVSLYISLRFEPKMAAGALVALVHDVLFTAGTYALVGREVTPETVIAVLTILGFSLYDTVVIYDKVKENATAPALAARETFSGIANLSLNQTFMRSVNTSLVVLLPIGALLLFGGQTLKDFAFALFIGVAVGAYSSIFVAVPVLTLLKEREARYRQIRARLALKEARPGLRAVRSAPRAAAPATPEFEPAAVRTRRPADEGVAAAPPSRPGAPRSTTATKKKKKKPQGKPKRRRR